MSNQIEGFIKGIILGGAIGAAIGILYAPQSGRETRKEIACKTDDLLAKAKEEYDKALERSKKTYESALKRLRDLELAAKERVGHLEGDVAEIVERGNEVLQDGKSRLNRALDVGVEAFKEEKTS
jgi:gas vesicle protein